MTSFAETLEVAETQSVKNIANPQRLIVALDVSTEAEAKKIVHELGDAAQFYKLGLQSLMSGSYFPLLKWLRSEGKEVLADIKFYDVPRTVRAAVEEFKKHEVRFATVHGTDEILRAACDAKNGTKILAVTVLTSFSQSDMDALGFKADIREVVLSRARRALEIGCDGVISSGLESKDIRSQLGERFLIVVPGVRPGDNLEVESDDQKRVVNVQQAFANGADYIVVGRPILNAADMRAAAEQIQEQIAQHFAST